MRMATDSNLVSRLVQDSFGKTWKSNVNIDFLSVGEPGWVVSETERLNRIVNMNFWNRIKAAGYFGWGSPEVAGKFFEQDGSKLQVAEKYRKKALDYTDTYKKETGNYPSIVLVDMIRPDNGEHLQKFRETLVFE